jgi:hypothetical protein
MRGAVILVLAVACLVPRPAAGQHEHHESPYAGVESSEIPALTAQELDGLRSGAGMGQAMAAELNHYPGPKHVLELGSELDLTSDQRRRVEQIHADMEARAIELGEAIIEAERMLDRRFEHRHIDEETLQALTTDIARLRGELRYTHLRAHLATRAVLNETQVMAYDRLRGYAEGE